MQDSMMNQFELERIKEEIDMMNKIYQGLEQAHKYIWNHKMNIQPNSTSFSQKSRIFWAKHEELHDQLDFRWSWCWKGIQETVDIIKLINPSLINLFLLEKYTKEKSYLYRRRQSYVNRG